MTKEQMIEALKACIVTKQEKLKFSVEVDLEKAVKEIVFVVAKDFVKDTANPYDDKLIEMLEKFLEQKLA